MYIRIARFEGSDPSRIDAFADEMRRQIDGMRRGEAPPAGMPADSAAVLRDHVTRVVDAADRETGRGLSMVFTETAEGARRVDEALDAMSPGEGGGRRTSAEIYEVLVDETMK
jgi:hypothetical protein